MRYRFTPEAFSDLQHIHDYIAEEQHHPIAAADVVAKIEQTLERISDNPLIGRKNRICEYLSICNGKAAIYYCLPDC